MVVRGLPRVRPWRRPRHSTGTFTPGSRLFVKLFVEEEDVTVSLLLDASPRWPPAIRRRSLFAKRAAAALGTSAGHRGSHRRALTGRVARRRAALHGSGRVFRLLADLSAIEPADGTDRPRHSRPARRGPAPRPGGLIVLSATCSTPAPTGDPRARRHRMRSIILHVLSPDELDPPLGESSTGRTEPRRVDTTADLATINAYQARLGVVEKSPTRAKAPGGQSISPWT